MKKYRNVDIMIIVCISIVSVQITILASHLSGSISTCTELSTPEVNHNENI